MRKIHLFGILGMLLAVVVFTGCSGQQGGPPKDSDKTTKKGGGDDHSHGSGPNGGAVADWGGGKYHVEFCMDHDKKQATVYVLDSNAKKPAPIKADKLLLSIKEP